jgi:hypothetical protein
MPLLASMSQNPDSVNGPTAIPQIPQGSQLPPTEGAKFMAMIRDGLTPNEKLSSASVKSLFCSDDE